MPTNTTSTHSEDKITWLTTQIQEQAAQLGFDASCELLTAQLLTTLVASKPGGRILELGTGIGLETAHLLAGMDPFARLETVELDESLSAAARDCLGEDHSIRFVVADGAAWMASQPPGTYDFIFADTWPGKFHALDTALALLAPGGLYVVDDLFPQPNCPEHHQLKVDQLRMELESHEHLVCTRLDWASGLMICVNASDRNNR